MNNKKIIDTHHLIGMDYWLSINKPELAYKNDIKKIISKDINAFIYPFPSSINQLYIEENKLIDKYAKQNKNLIPVFALNTNFQESYESIKQYVNNHELFGIIIWPILCNIDLLSLVNDENFKKFSEEYNFFIYIHTGAGNEKDIKRVEKLGNYTPDDVIEFARHYDNKKFILGHMLRLSYNNLLETKNLANVVIETSGISSHMRWFENNQNVFPSYDSGILMNMDSKSVLEYCINKLGLEDKLVFGSSYPYCLWWNFDLEDEIDLIYNLNISKEQKEKILNKNIIKFLNLK